MDIRQLGAPVALLIRDLVAGTCSVVLAAYVAVVLSPAGDPAARVLVMAVACGVLGTLLADWRASVFAAAVAAGVFVGPLTDEAGAGAYTPIIGFAALLGAGNRIMRRTTAGSTSGDAPG
jgi:hypothetical protein